MKAGQGARDERRRAARQGAELQEQLFRLRFQKSLGQLDNGLKIRETRRDIARVKTVLREKRGRAQVAAGASGRDRRAWKDQAASSQPARAAATSRWAWWSSAKMQKTVVVAVERLVRHGRLPQDDASAPRPSWPTTRRAAKQGDTVRIVETRPLSRNKRWRVEEIVAARRRRGRGQPAGGEGQVRRTP